MPNAGILYGRSKGDAQIVRTGLQNRLYVPTVLPEHVFGAAQRLAVQFDGRQRIQAVADQEDAFLGQQVSHDGEAAPILPIRLSNPLHPFLVVADEWVRDTARGHQIGVNAAGHIGRQPFVSARLAELPGAS